MEKKMMKMTSNPITENDFEANDLAEAEGSEFTEKGIKRSELMGGFLKGLSVIEVFSSNPDGLTSAEVARLTGLDRAAARRCILTLVETGYAIANGRVFSLTPKVLKLSKPYLNSSVPKLIQPMLQKFSDDTDLFCACAVLENDSAVFISQFSRPTMMSISVKLGTQMPLYYSAIGRCLLAGMEEEQARKVLENYQFVKRTAFTLSDVDQIMEKVREAKRLGYAIVDQEIQVGLKVIAVPLFNEKNEVFAAVNCGVLSSLYPDSKLIESILPKMLDIQKQFQETLKNTV